MCNVYIAALGISPTADKAMSNLPPEARCSVTIAQGAFTVSAQTKGALVLRRSTARTLCIGKIDVVCLCVVGRRNVENPRQEPFDDGVFRVSGDACYFTEEYLRLTPHGRGKGDCGTCVVAATYS